MPIRSGGALSLGLGFLLAGGAPARASEPPVATFSIAAHDPETGELGVAVASRFFAVGVVVPWVKAGVGAIATQAYANTTYGPDGLALLAQGLAPAQVVERLTKADEGRARRQLGVVSASGAAATYTGEGCSAWAGGRRGPGYAVQGNILAGAAVVEAMEQAFLASRGDLAERMYQALLAGEAKGGDSRGKQSAALVVARRGGGYSGFDDRFIDVRVDDHPEPFQELGRLLNIARVNGRWNLAWTAFMKQDFAGALPLMEQTASAAEAASSSALPEVYYDLAVIRGAAAKKPAALEALARALALNPKLVEGARSDKDLDVLRAEPGFALLVPEALPESAE